MQVWRGKLYAVVLVPGDPDGFRVEGPSAPATVFRRRDNAIARAQELETREPGTDAPKAKSKPATAPKRAGVTASSKAPARAVRKEKAPTRAARGEAPAAASTAREETRATPAGRAVWKPSEEQRRFGADYWSALQAIHAFDPDSLVYLDFENEVALSVFVPDPRSSKIETAPPSGDPRFTLIQRRPGEKRLDVCDVPRVEAVMGRSHDRVSEVVTFAPPGTDKRPSTELHRARAVFGARVFPTTREIDLHSPLTKARGGRGLGRFFDDRSECILRRDDTQKRPSRCLEALERAFSLKRPLAVRGHTYIDAAGVRGEMKILERERLVSSGKASAAQEREFRAYCHWDVWSMHQILLRARACAWAS